MMQQSQQRDSANPRHCFWRKFLVRHLECITHERRFVCICYAPYTAGLAWCSCEEEHDERDRKALPARVLEKSFRDELNDGIRRDVVGTAAKMVNMSRDPAVVIFVMFLGFVNSTIFFPQAFKQHHGSLSCHLSY
jgi:hypothetical protein